jgi:hypothetical protein
MAQELRLGRPAVATLGMFVVGLIAAPFLATGLFRVLPDFVFWLPFVLLLGISAVLVANRRYRAAGLGLAVGTLVWAVLLMLLLVDMGRAMRDFGS